MSIGKIKKVWLDGELVDNDKAVIHSATNTLHYGLGVFEGIRSYSSDGNSYIFRLKDHVTRLFKSAHILNIEIPYTMEEVELAILNTLKANDLEEAYIKPMVYLGNESLSLDTRHLSVHLMILAWDAYRYTDNGMKGIKVNISSFTRHHVNIAMTKAKANGNYMNSQLALREAKNAGVDDVFLLDSDGYVSEATGANVFMVSDGILYTPELTNCLDGITRKTVIQLAEEAGVSVVDKRITRDELYIAGEVFITGTAAEILPVCEVDARRIGTGEIGKVTEYFIMHYADIVRGKVAEYHLWNTPVPLLKVDV